MRRIPLYIFFFIFFLTIVQSCTSESDIIVDYFPPSYYSNEKCDIVDTIVAPIDTPYLVDVWFRRIYNKVIPFNTDDCSNSIAKNCCGRFLSEYLQEGRDSIYRYKLDSLQIVVAAFMVKNLSTDKYVDIFYIDSDDPSPVEYSSDLQRILKPILMDYVSDYKNQADQYTVVVSNRFSCEEYIFSPERKILIIPDN